MILQTFLQLLPLILLLLMLILILLLILKHNSATRDYALFEYTRKKTRDDTSTCTHARFGRDLKKHISGEHANNTRSYIHVRSCTLWAGPKVTHLCGKRE